MNLLRNIAYLVLLVLVLLLVVVFSALNPGLVTLDLAVGTFDIQKSLAMTLAFGAGWVFGLLCAGIVLLRGYTERRRVSRQLRMAEEEVRALRSLPIQDAD
jgi:uncharacterized membrane protein YciS (DUF1049 family)